MITASGMVICREFQNQEQTDKAGDPKMGFLTVRTKKAHV